MPGPRRERRPFRGGWRPAGPLTPANGSVGAGSRPRGRKSALNAPYGAPFARRTHAPRSASRSSRTASGTSSASTSTTWKTSAIAPATRRGAPARRSSATASSASTATSPRHGRHHRAGLLPGARDLRRSGPRRALRRRPRSHRPGEVRRRPRHPHRRRRVVHRRRARGPHRRPRQASDDVERVMAS